MENPPQCSALAAKLLKNILIVILQLLGVGVQKSLPTKAFRDDVLASELPISSLLRHFKEQQQGQLIDVVDSGDTIVPQYMAVIPQLVDGCRELAGLVVFTTVTAEAPALG